MATPRCGAAMVSMGGKLYIAGGIEYFSAGTNAAPACSPSTTPSTRRDASGTSSAEVYDPIKDSWSSIASMSDVSGWNQCPNDPSIAPWTFDKLGPWFFLPACLAFGNKFYVVGGTRLSTGWNWSPTSTGQVYDPIDNTWNFIPNLPFCSGVNGAGWPGGSSNGRAATSMCECGGKFNLIGGIYTYDAQNAPASRAIAIDVITFDPSLVQMPQITHQGEDFYISHQRGGPKTFIIPHPEPKHEGKMLRHACVEAPTRGTNMYEYQIEVKEDNAITKIELPSYFKHLNSRPRIYITPRNVMSGYYGDVNNERNTSIIYTEKAGIFDIKVTGIRNDEAALDFSLSEYIDAPTTP
jgi:hypothetical protein